MARILGMADLGTCDPTILDGAPGQVATIGAFGHRIGPANGTFLLSEVRGIQPPDERESMQALQIGTLHQATMMMARRWNHVTTIPQQDAVKQALNKLA